MQRTIVLVALFALFFSPTTLKAETDAKAFDAFVTTYLNDYYTWEPLGAIDMGLTGKEEKYFGAAAKTRTQQFNHSWPDFHSKALAGKIAVFSGHAKTLRDMRADVAKLDDDRKVNYNMMVARNNLIHIWFQYSRGYSLAVNCAGNMNAAVFPSTLRALETQPMPASAPGDAFERILGLKPYLEGCAEAILVARDAGHSLNADLLGAAGAMTTESITQVEQIVAKIPDSYFTKDVSRQSVQQVATEALKEFAAKLEGWGKECLDCRSTIGADEFTARWKYAFGRPEDAKTVAEEAKAELARLSNEMGTRATALAKAHEEKGAAVGSPAEIMAALIKEATPATIEDALTDYRERTSRYLTKSRALFDLPEAVGVRVELPPAALRGLGAAYLPSPLFNPNGIPSMFYVDDAGGLDFHNAYSAAFIAAHEVAPGHGLQFAMLQKYSDQLSPVRVLDNTADSYWGEYLSAENVEGWGLYAESIPLEVLPGFYNETEALFVIQSRAFRAARAYIEYNVQIGKMTKEEAEDIFANQVFFPAGGSKRQASSFFMLPAQRGSYYLGARRIEALRAEILKITGKEKFTIDDYKQFHSIYFRYGMVPIALFSEALLNVYRKAAGQPTQTVPLLDVL